MQTPTATRVRAKRRIGAALCLASILAVAGGGALAQTADEKGLAIVREAERRNDGWIDSVGQARMILRDTGQQSSERKLEMRSLEGRGEAGEGKGLLIFRSPPDVSGTILLTHSFKTREDDQWIYLPEIARVKRISSSGKAGSFMGSEFSYEDMRDAQIEKYAFTWIRDEPCGESSCFVVERRPKDADSMYSRQMVWIDRQTYVTHRVQFFNRSNYHIKTLTLTDHRLYQTKFWRPHLLRMVNHQTGKSTDLIWDSYKFGQGLAQRDFERNSLSWLR